MLLAGYIGYPRRPVGQRYQLLAITVAGVAGVLFTGGPGSIASVVSSCLFLVLLDQVLSVKGCLRERVWSSKVWSSRLP